MSSSETLTRYLQENILALACFDDDAAPVIRGSIAVENFDNAQYQKIISRTYDYIDEFDQAPKSHLPDILEDLIENKDDKRAELYRSTVENIYEAIENGINANYVLKQLSDFTRAQTVKAGLINAVKEAQANNIAEAELIIEKALNSRQVSFQRGLMLTDSDAFAFLDQEDDWIRIGIDAFDERGICPAPKELMTLMAPSGRGKTWFMIHIGKMALMQGKKVLHITLEMSEKKTMQRYIQSLFSVSKRESEFEVVNFIRDSEGSLDDFDFTTVKDRPHFKQPDLKKTLRKKVNKLHKRKNFIIKEFPTGSLTSKELEAYLETLERHDKFVPDIIIVDYADLFKMKGDDKRVATGEVYKELRGIGVKRNCAMVTATQSNRVGESSTLLNLTHLAEDYSKAAISDNVITYNQTDAEHDLGVARLYVAKGRNDEAFLQVLISQQYGMGQFALDSIKLDSQEEYWSNIEEHSE